MKCAGYVMGGVWGDMRIARGVPPTPTKLENKNEKNIKKNVDKFYVLYIIVFKLMQRLHQRNNQTNKVNMNITKNMNIWIASVTTLIVVLSIAQNANAALKKVCVTDNGTKVACITLKKGGK